MSEEITPTESVSVDLSNISQEDLDKLRDTQRASNLKALEEDPQYLKDLEDVLAQAEVGSNEKIVGICALFRAGEISKDQFEPLFTEAFEEMQQAKYQDQREKLMFAYSIGLNNETELKKANEMNERVHFGMDLKEHYVEVIRKDNILDEVHVHKRKTYPDGTPRLVVQDLNPLEASQYLRYNDLKAYHDDGDLNVELTAALQEDLANRRQERARSRYLRRMPVLPTNPTGRNDACPCGSGKKYKKCHLLLGDAPVIPLTIEEAQEKYGKDVFEFGEMREKLDLTPKVVEAKEPCTAEEVEGASVDRMYL